MRDLCSPLPAVLLACGLLFSLPPARAQLPPWSQDAQKKWWAANPTLPQEANAANILQQQLASDYHKNGASAFSQLDFQNWLDLYEWIKLGLASGGLLSLPANFNTYVALGNDTTISHLLVERMEPQDIGPAALAILLKLQQANPADLHEYAALGVAYALVFDAPFPDDWPHSQVARKAVPIGDTDPVVRFRFYVAANRAHQLQLDLTQANFEALKWVVDSEVSLKELSYGQKETTPYTSFASAFFSIKYTTLRVEGNSVYDWNLLTYRLQDIEAAGGICIDQSYYAATVGKARGIPTMMLSGLGDLGAHAWFGYLDKSGSWQLDCGRYESQNYAKGYAHDPQTWEEIKDTDWQQFMKNGVNDPAYPAAHAALRWARLQGASPLARSAYDDAHTIMPALAEAWSAEADYLDQVNAPIEDQKTFYQQWITQIAPFADQKVAAQRRLVAALRKANDSSAESVEQDIILQNRTGGIDLAVDGTVEALEDHFKSGDWDGARMEFERSVRDFGDKGGGTYYYRLVDPYIRNCWQRGLVAQAGNGLHFTEDRTKLDTPVRGSANSITIDFDQMKASQADIEAAVAAMQTWLGEIDAGNVDQAWGEASPTMPVTAKDVTAARQKAGNLTSRTLVGVSHHESNSGPDGMLSSGPVVTARFMTVFESTTLQETVSALKKGPHSWQTSSYEGKAPEAAAPATASK